MGVESDVVFVFLVEIDFVLVCGPEITWFWRMYVNLLGCNSVVRNLDFRVGAPT